MPEANPDFDFERERICDALPELVAERAHHERGEP